MPKVTFNNQNRDFFNHINSRVEEYFNLHNLKKTGNKKLYFKAFLLIAAALFLYAALLFVPTGPVPAILLCCMLGFAQASIGFNIMHDANHSSFSEKKWINTVMGLSGNILGMNAWMWKQKHNLVHHTYTNIDGMDDDIAKSPFLRLCPSQKRLKLHSYQHIYCMPLYAFSSIRMIMADFPAYFGWRRLVSAQQKMETREHLIFWISKFLYFFFFLALPVSILGFWTGIIGFVLMHLVLGVTLASVFQLAHLVEITHFVDAPRAALRIENEWAIHQVMTTADFATHNKMISWFTGGLNFQVEHHLFPKVSHLHYPAIHEFVKDACRKFSVRLNHNPTMTAALCSHIRLLKQLGKPENGSFSAGIPL